MTGGVFRSSDESLRVRLEELEGERAALLAQCKHRPRALTPGAIAMLVLLSAGLAFLPPVGCIAGCGAAPPKATEPLCCTHGRLHPCGAPGLR
jgi:hypothetical protein